MSNPNSVTVAGNLTKDPELRFLAGGQATTSFSLAVNRSWQNQTTREWEEETSYFDVVCWGDLAQNVAESASRGIRCVVSGRLGQRSWEHEGQKRSQVEITADERGAQPPLRYRPDDQGDPGHGRHQPSGMRTQRQRTDAQVVNAGRDAVALARSDHCDDIAGADTMLDQMDWREVDVTLVAAACLLARAARLLSQEVAWCPDTVFERLLDGLGPSGPAGETTFPPGARPGTWPPISEGGAACWCS